MTGPRIQVRPRPERQFLYSGRSMLVTDLTGGINGREEEGFYFHNTRLLSQLQLLVGDEPVRAFAFSPVGRDAALAFLELPQPKAEIEEEIEQEVSAVFARIGFFVGDGLRVWVTLLNYAHHPVTVPLGLAVAADFAAPQEASMGRRGVEAPVEVDWDDAASRLLLSLKDQQLDRAVAIRLEQSPPVGFSDGHLETGVEVPARGETSVDLVVEPRFDQHPAPAPPPSFQSRTSLSRLRQRLAAEMPRLETSNPTVARTWETAVGDLAALPLGLAQGPAAPIAGVPLYQQVFGRDMLTTGWQALLAGPELLRDALVTLAATQGERIDDWRDEEPGKLLHQAGDAPPSVLGKDPFLHYYGDYATPVDFLAMLGQYYLWTGDITTVARCLPHARRAIKWLERYGDLDGDGLLEYETRSEKGVKNQGWKDAANAIVDAEGRNVSNPITGSELQGYWYAGLRNAAAAFFAAKDRVYASQLLSAAARLRKRIEQRFWMESEGTYALGLGPDKQPITSVASNAGHLLATGAASPRRGRRVAERLLAPDMFSGWGIRTLSSEHPAYNPFSYHLGSVWPVEQGTIAAGFARYRCIPQLHRLARGFFEASELFSENRLPESIGGLDRSEQTPHPGIYPKANSPQAWSASAVVLMIQALLGLRPLAPLRTLVVDPQLPDWLPELSLRGVRFGPAVVDLHASRDRRGETRLRAEPRQGRVRVIYQPGVRTPGVGLWDRAGWLIGP